MELKGARTSKWGIRKEGLGVYFIFLINFWMACYEVVASTTIKHYMTYKGYDLIFPLVIGLPWVVIAISQKNKWAWVRSVLVIVLAYAARALTISLAYGLLGRDINMFLLKYFHKSISFRLDWIVNVIYLILLSLVAFWIYKDELKIKKENRAAKFVKSVQKPMIKQEEKSQAKVQQDVIVQLNNILQEGRINEENLATKAENIDINRCSESEFMTLPGMSLITAKKAVENREKNGDYESLDDFVVRNNIKPHFMIQMESKIYVATTKKISTSNNEKKGRVLDL